MSVFLEFTIEPEGFILGQVLSEPPSMHIELERIVPAGDNAVPFLWVTGDDFERFEQTILDHDRVADLFVLDEIEDSTLYRVQWQDSPHDLIQTITETDGTILEAYADEQWYFRLRFSDHDALSTFHTYCTERELPIHIVRTYTETDRPESGEQFTFSLSQEQREALVLGLRRGYFDTPSQVSLEELADELEISQQAMSDRIRRGTKHILHEALLASTPDFE